MKSGLLSLRSALWAFGAFVACQASWAPQPVYAGVVVLKNGEVIIGRIRDEEVSEEALIVRWPYKERTDRGEFKIPMFRIRWYDSQSDRPTDAYWDKYEDVAAHPIDAQYHPLLARYQLRKREDAEGLGDLLIVPEQFMSRDLRLSPRPYENEHLKVQKPDTWSSSVEDGITIFVSDKPGAAGFRPRIHVFSVPAVAASDEDQLRWIEAEAARLAASGGFEVRERERARPRGRGFDQVTLTRTVRLDRPVLALRLVSFRNRSTHFFTAYAHENDYSAHEILFKMCMRSIEIFEDQEAGPPTRSIETSTDPAGGDERQEDDGD